MELLASLPEAPHGCLHAPHAAPAGMPDSAALLIRTTGMLVLREMHTVGNRADSSGALTDACIVCARTCVLTSLADLANTLAWCCFWLLFTAPFCRFILVTGHDRFLSYSTCICI